MKEINTSCSMCSSKCGVRLQVENNTIVKVTNMKEHLLNRMCPKGAGMSELMTSPERLTDPLQKHGDGWRKMTWDEALSLIAERLEAVRRDYGPQSLWVMAGYPWNSSHTQTVIKRFTELYGSPNFTNVGSVCYRARVLAHTLTVGGIISMDYAGEPHCEIIWGKNPDENWPPYGRAVRRMVDEGRGKLIVVDPRSTPLAKKAHIHARVRPGTDCALALGLLHVVIAEGLYDKTFVADWTVGFDALVEHVKAYPPERVAEITGVPAETVLGMARLYAANRPGIITTGIAVEHSTNGIQSLRAIAILEAISGNMDVPGGNKCMPKLTLKNLSVPQAVRYKVPVDGGQYPLFNKIINLPTFLPGIDQLVTGKPYPIKAMIIAGNNPMVTWPNFNKVSKGLRQVDFKVVIDVFMTETARLADIVLPGSTFLERADLRNYLQHYGDPSLMLTQQACTPVGNAREDWWIWAELGRKMGFGEYYPWQSNDELVDDLLATTRVTRRDLEVHPEGVPYADREFRRYLTKGFETPSGKVEIYSETMKSMGYDPLPTFQEPQDSPLSRPELAKEYPLTIFSYRINPFTGSQYFNLPAARKRAPEPLVDIHPDTARCHGIADGDWVNVESLRGRIRTKARVTEDVPPGIIGAPFGWGGEANVNKLTDDMRRDPISGYPSFKPLCRITKA